jgi:protein O-mannosyl-transferase
MSVRAKKRRDDRVSAPKAGGESKFRPISERSWKTWGFPALIVLVGAVVYSDSLSGPFILDDKGHVTGDGVRLAVQSASGVLRYIFGIGRPVASLSILFNRALGGEQVWGYHAFNLAIHLLAAMALFGLARRTLRSPRLAGRYGASADELGLAVALVWVAHPLTTQAVTYTVQRMESMASLFYLLTLYCVARRSACARPGRWTALAIVCCAAGMASKQIALSAPLMALLYEQTFGSNSLKETLARSWRLYAGLAATWLFLALLLSLQSIGSSAGFCRPNLPTPLNYLWTELAVIPHYLRLAVWPDSLCFDYVWPFASGPGGVPPSALIAGGAIGATLVFAWRAGLAGPVAFLWAVFFLVLAPTSSVMPVADAAAEQRMYLPLAAVVTLVVVGAYSLGKRLALRMSAARGAHGSAGAPLAWAALVLTVGALGIVTYSRNMSYRTAETVWRDVLAKRPNNARALGHLGKALQAAGRQKEAEDAYERSLRLDPNQAEIHNNLACVMAMDGNLDQASLHYAQAVRIQPNYPEACNNLGIVLGRQGKYDQAIAYSLQAVKLQPGYAPAHSNLSYLKRKTRKLDEALAEAREAVRLDPSDQEARDNLASALRMMTASADSHTSAGLAIEDGSLQPGGKRLLSRR